MNLLPRRPKYEGYADPGFQKELTKLPERDQKTILSALHELTREPIAHPNVKTIESTKWPGTIRIRTGPYRTLALILPKPRLILFTTVFRKKRSADYKPAIRRHEKRVTAQGPPLDEFLKDY